MVKKEYDDRSSRDMILNLMMRSSSHFFVSNTHWSSPVGSTHTYFVYSSGISGRFSLKDPFYSDPAIVSFKVTTHRLMMNDDLEGNTLTTQLSWYTSWWWYNNNDIMMIELIKTNLSFSSLSDINDVLKRWKVDLSAAADLKHSEWKTIKSDYSDADWWWRDFKRDLLDISRISLSLSLSLVCATQDNNRSSSWS